MSTRAPRQGGNGRAHPRRSEDGLEEKGDQAEGDEVQAVPGHPLAGRGAATSSTAIPWMSSAKLGWMPTSCRAVDPARKAPKNNPARAAPGAVAPPMSATAIPSNP